MKISHEAVLAGLHACPVCPGFRSSPWGRLGSAETSAVPRRLSRQISVLLDPTKSTIQPAIPKPPGRLARRFNAHPVLLKRAGRGRFFFHLASQVKEL